jgi:hypothetical protein
MAGKRTDATQKEIVEALRRCGAHVVPLHEVGRGVPDLLCGFRGRWYLVECKTGKNWKYTPAQKKFHAEADAPVLTLTSATDAVTWAANVRQPAMTDDGDAEE